MSQEINTSPAIYTKDDEDTRMTSEEISMPSEVYSKKNNEDIALNDVLEITKTDLIKEKSGIQTVDEGSISGSKIQPSVESPDELTYRHNDSAFTIDISTDQILKTNMNSTLQNLELVHKHGTSEFVENITNQMINQSSESPMKMDLCDQNTKVSDFAQDLKAGVVDFEEIPVEMDITSAEQQCLTNNESTLKENNDILEISKEDFKSLLDISNIDYTSTQSETLASLQRNSESIVIKVLIDSDTEMDDVIETFESVDENSGFENLAPTETVSDLNKTTESVDKKVERKRKATKMLVPVERKLTRSFFQPVVPITSHAKYKDGDSDSENEEDNAKNEMKCEFKCTYCDKAYSEQRTLTYHINTKHELLECAECGLKVGSYKALIDHANNHESALFSCKKCEIAFSDAIDFLTHSARHRKEKTIACEICSKIYKNGNLYKAHISIHKERLVNCKICSKAFGNVSKLNLHMKYHEKNIMCPECGKELATRKDLDYHMVSHTGLKIHQCLYCGQGFANASQRDTHTKRRHLGVKFFECKVCNASHKNAEALDEHFKTTHTEKNVQCEICDRKFYNNRMMKAHLRSHEKTKFSCHLCKFTCAFKGELKSHIVYNHTTEKIFSCDLCNVSFKLKNHLLRHNRESISHKVLEKNRNAGNENLLETHQKIEARVEEENAGTPAADMERKIEGKRGRPCIYGSDKRM